MTAELGIFNKSCVVLAADSAVSYRAGDGLIPRNTATKIFTLSDFHPVGIMIFGNPSYRGIPIELVIKGFRRQMRGKALPHLVDYQAAFVAHLHEYDDYGESEEKWWMQTMANVLLAADDVGKMNDPEGETRSIADELQRLETAWAAEADLENVQPDDEAEFLDRLYAVAGQALSHFYADEAQSGAELQDALCRVAYLALRKAKFFNPTGLVIAGYGDRAIFPGSVSFYIEGQCGGNPRVSRLDIFQVTHDQPSNVIPFAQGDVSMTVLRGIDPWFFKMVIDTATQMIVDYNEQLVAASGADDPAALREALQEMGAQAIAELTAQIQNYQAEHHVKPTLGAIDVLSKEDLVEVAEALISLTTIKKRVSQQAEDVGGPVDIAVLTKEDGFVWIKRKNYFSPELNPEHNARISSTFH